MYWTRFTTGPFVDLWNGCRAVSPDVYIVVELFQAQQVCFTLGFSHKLPHSRIGDPRTLASQSLCGT